MTDWFATFLLTLVIELAVAVPLLAIIEPAWRIRVGLVVVANVATHPIVYFTAAAASSWQFFPGVVLGLELVAALTETLVYARAFGTRPWLPAAFSSFLANGASLMGSIVLAALAQWR